MKIASASRRAWHGMQADCCRKPPPVSERGFQEKQTRVKSASKSSSQPAQQYSTQSSYRPRALLQETNRKKSCVIQQDKPQSARGPQQLLGARRYASEATPQQAAAEAHHAGPADLNGQRFVVATSSYTEAGTSQGPLQAEARQLRDLLIDATGRNPAKQRQIAWAAQEGGAEEEEEWLRRLDWAASPASSSRNTFVTGELGLSMKSTYLPCLTLFFGDGLLLHQSSEILQKT